MINQERPKLVMVVYELEKAIPVVEGTVQEEVPEWQSPSYKRRRNPRFIALVALVIVLMGGLLWWFLPEATITITPQSKQIIRQLEVILDTSGHAAADAVPGRALPMLSMSQERTTATSGVTSQPALPARGTITFYNAALYPQTIVANTLLTSASGVEIVTDRAVVVPAAAYPTFGSAIVGAHAVLPGPRGNVQSGDIYGTCCLYGISASNVSFSGGEMAQTYRSVAQTDIDDASSQVKRWLTQALETVARTQTDESQTLVTPLSCEHTVIPSHAVGERAEAVKVTVTASCRGLAYETKPFQNHLSDTPLPHYQITARKAVVQSVLTGENGTYKLRVEVLITYRYDFTHVEQERLALRIAGKESSEAMRIVRSAPGVDRVSMSATMLPRDAHRIRFMFITQ